MGSIVTYQKYIDADITVELKLPVDKENKTLGQELATVDGKTYCFVDGVLPEQSKKISASVKEVVVDAALRALLNEHSPQIKLIDQNTKANIAARYSIEDEIKMLRVGGDAFVEYNDFVEACRADGQAKKAQYGL